MNPKKPLSDASWLGEELQALRAEQPSPESIERTVLLMQAPPPTVNRPRANWKLRAATLAAAAALLVVLVSVGDQRANASTLRQIAEVFRAHRTRHQKTYRPDANGRLALRNEGWQDGDKQSTRFYEPDGTCQITGYDGHVMFNVTLGKGGFVDDGAPSGIPVEDIDTYITIPGAHLLSRALGRQVDGRSVDLYTIGFSDVKFTLFVDPKSQLPVRRDVLTLHGVLIERNEYDYPSLIPAATFRLPAHEKSRVCDYPALRARLQRQLLQGGETKEVAGVRITLRAVLVGSTKVMALWTGGAPVDGSDSKGGLRILGDGQFLMDSAPEPFSVPSEVPRRNSRAPLFVGKERLFGQQAWYAEPVDWRTPFTIDMPVWEEDRSRPIVSADGRKLGYHSKQVGRLQFVVSHVIRADDPERVLWRPSNDVVETGTTR